MRIVIDTNVLLDLLVFDDPRARALRALLDDGRVRGLRAEATDAELADVLARSRFGLERCRQNAALAWWHAVSDPVRTVHPAPWRCTDACDQKFLDLAVSGRAQLLVSRDKALLKLARRTRTAGLDVLPPERATAAPTGPGVPLPS